MWHGLRHGGPGDNPLVARQKLNYVKTTSLKVCRQIEIIYGGRLEGVMGAEIQ